MLGEFGIARPADLEDVLSRIDDDTIPYWGGTELLLAMKLRLLTPSVLVDLKGVPGLTDVAVVDDALVIGAGASHDAVATHPLVLEHAPFLSTVASQIGNARVRAQGTVGGNLCFAEPRSDWATALLALDGTLTLASRAGIRRLGVPEFLLGPYWTAREPDELLVSLSVPLPAPTGVYRKLSLTERPTATVAAVAADAAAGNPCRVAVGAVTDVPRLFAFAQWEDVDAESIVAVLDPTDDPAGSVEYKRHVAGVLVRRSVEAMRQGAADE